MGLYFGREQEEIVLKYLKSGDEFLFHDEIYPLLKRIARGVSAGKRFRPVSLYQSPAVIDGCVSHLWECMKYKYDPDRQTKAFSYLTRVAHNYFCGVSRQYQKGPRTWKLANREILRTWKDAHNKINPVTLHQNEEFFRFYYVEMAAALKTKADEIKAKKPSSPRSAIINSLRKQMTTVRKRMYCDKYINKKAIYSNIRRSTGATTKQISATIKQDILPLYHPKKV
tara:strand:+ start:1430 stop:2107 length:678 start_codon:yes stop_codon:yes gene_type:complete